MKDSLIIIFAAIIVLQILNMLLSQKKKTKNNKKRYNEKSYIERRYNEQRYNESEYNKNDDNTVDNKMPYKKKLLLTKNEWNFYKGISQICSERNLHIIAKVRLADLVEIDEELDKKQWQTYFNKIQNKHIDFVLCNPANLKVIALVELDDKSHNRQNRIERDNFINKLCQKVGYKLIRVKRAEELKIKISELE